MVLLASSQTHRGILTNLSRGRLSTSSFVLVSVRQLKKSVAWLFNSCSQDNWFLSSRQYTAFVTFRNPRFLMEKTPLFQSAPAKVNLENVIRKQRVWDISHLLANCYRAFREFNRLLFCPQEGFYVSKQFIFPASGIKIYYRNVITKLKSLIGVIAIVEDEEVCWEPLAALHSSEVGLEQALPLNMLKERCSSTGQEDERESFL